MTTQCCGSKSPDTPAFPGQESPTGELQCQARAIGRRDFRPDPFPDHGLGSPCHHLWDIGRAGFSTGDAWRELCRLLGLAGIGNMLAKAAPGCSTPKLWDGEGADGASREAVSGRIWSLRMRS